MTIVALHQTSACLALAATKLKGLPPYANKLQQSIAAGLVEESAISGRTRSELLSDVNQDTRPYKRQPHNSFEAYFSSDAAALVEHTRRCAACCH